jgi:hypothetical protein
MISNCPVSADTITNVHTIIGPDLASGRGKTVRWTLEPVVGNNVSVPRSIVEQNKTVTFEEDVVFVDGIAFL